MLSRGFSILCLVLLALFAANLSNAVGASRPPVLIIFCDCLRFDDLHSFEHIAELADRSAIGLMNCTVSGPKNSVSAMLTIASGRHSLSEALDKQAANDFELIQSEDGSAAQIYERRTGLHISAPAAYPAHADVFPLHHLGIGSLTRRGFSEGLLGSALHYSSPHISTTVFGNADTDIFNRSGALLGIDSTGAASGYVAINRRFRQAPFQRADDPISLAELVQKSNADLIIVQFGDLSRTEEARSHLSERDYSMLRNDGLRRLDTFLQLTALSAGKIGKVYDILLISSRPQADDSTHPQSWNRLPPILASGPDFPTGLLTSATTRTVGLIANIDIAPIILTLFHTPIPDVMEGRKLRIIDAESSSQDRMSTISQLDIISNLNGIAVAKLMVAIGSICFVGVLACLFRYAKGGAAAAHRWRTMLIFTLNLPIALLLAPWPAPHSLFAYGLRIIGWMALLTAVETVLESKWKNSASFTAAMLTIVILVIDTLTGQNLIKNSMLSLYPISGIRYYGIGNEYLGVILAFAYFSGMAWLDDRKISAPDSDNSNHTNMLSRGPFEIKLLFALWIGLAFLIGWPGLGANAGSLAATATAIGVAGTAFAGRRVGWRAALISMGVGIGLAFIFALLDNWYSGQTGGERSHLGSAMHAGAGVRGYHYLLEIIIRKVEMNYRLLFSPGLLLAMLGVSLTYFAAKSLLGRAIERMLQRRHWTAMGLKISLFTAFAALLFKDSGVVTVTFFAGGICIHTLLFVIRQD